MAFTESKCWPAEFEGPRACKDRLYVRSVDGLGAAAPDVIETFFDFDRDTETVPEIVEEDVIKACKGVGLKLPELERGISDPGYNRSIWMSDRCSSSPDEPATLQVADKLRTPTSLLRTLRKKLEQERGGARASQTRIYICGWSPWTTLALASTAKWSQRTAIKDVICNHFEFKPSLEVKLTLGYKRFILSLHLPYFILRKTKKRPSVNPVGPQRKWTDLSFLDMEPSHPGQVWGLSQTAFTCVVTGDSDWNWVCYGIADPKTDGAFSDLEPHEIQNFDPLVCRGIMADTESCPIGRPREYFLTILEARMEQVYKECKTVVERLERQIEEYIGKHSLTRDRQARIVRQREELKARFVWVTETNKITGEVYKLHTDWADVRRCFFDSDTGDIRYFYGTNPRPEHTALLGQIHSKFVKLQKLEKRLAHMKESCGEYYRALDTLLGVEAKNSSDSSVELANIMIYFFSPLALGGTIFSIDQAALPFQLNQQNLFISLFVLCALTPLVRLLCVPIVHYITGARTKANACLVSLLASVQRARAPPSPPRDEESNGDGDSDEDDDDDDDDDDDEDDDDEEEGAEEEEDGVDAAEIEEPTTDAQDTKILDKGLSGIPDPKSSSGPNIEMALLRGRTFVEGGPAN